ncbi:MAG TPA: hypothetical protein VGB99_06375 [Acidobacteriota bacterium]
MTAIAPVPAAAVATVFRPRLWPHAKDGLRRAVGGRGESDCLEPLIHAQERVWSAGRCVLL